MLTRSHIFAIGSFRRKLHRLPVCAKGRLAAASGPPQRRRTHVAGCPELAKAEPRTPAAAVVENVFTFHAWKALGRSVKKGEHGVKVVTFIEASARDTSEAGEETVRTYRKPHSTTVFHISQTELTAEREARKPATDYRAPRRLPKDYGRPGLDKLRLGQTINLVSDIALGSAADRAKDNDKALAECKADKSWRTFETAASGHAVMIDAPEWLTDILLQVS
jgi:hypothetical protein